MATGSTSSRPILVSLVVFLLILVLSESIALLLEYQNNSFLQQYVTSNTTLFYSEAFGILLLALGAGLFAYRATQAKPTGKTGRTSRRILSLSPVILGIFSLIFWYTILEKFFTGITSLEAYVVLVLLLISAGMMLRDRITVRMALRNFTRRKTNMAIVIAGLMIGTAMISGSLVTGDTLTELFTRGAYYGYGHADEVVYTRDVATGGYQFFNVTLANDLQKGIANNPSASPVLLGVTPEILEVVSVNDTTKNIVQAGATLIGTYGNASQTLGDFHSSDGSVIQSNLSINEVVLNDRAARDLNATVGDQITVYSPRDATLSVSLRLVGVAVSDARGYFSQGDNVFVSMDTAQLLAQRPGMANYIAITNTGGLRGSIQYTSAVGFAANQTLNGLQQPGQGQACKTTASEPGSSTTIYCAYGSKKVAVDNAIAGAQNLSDFFVVLSTITILAGVVLIINIFVMLAEERKSEMGMARAVGMKRGQLTKLFLFEGSFYSAGASLVGVFAGIGIAYAILYAFGKIISSVFPVSLDQVLNSFTFTPTSLFTAFTEGLLITYFTILLTSWRVSKLNIIRAIRDVPEPPRGVKTYTVLLVLGVILAIIGVLMFRSSFSARSAFQALLGPSLVIFGAGFVLARFLPNRYAFSLTGLALLAQWGIPSLSYNNPMIQNYNFGPELFIAGGLIMVLGAVMLFMYNTNVILRVSHYFYQGRKTLIPIFKTALSYPSNKRFRTSATVAMFALVMFSVSTIAVLAAEQNAALDNLVKRDSGGYDIITQTTIPIPDLTARIYGNTVLSPKVAAVLPFNNTILLVHDVTSGHDFGPQLTVGADPNAPAEANFYKTNTFSMVNMTSEYKSADEVWNAVSSDSTNVVWSFSFFNNRGPPAPTVSPSPGDILQVFGQLPNGTIAQKHVTVVGLLNGIFFSGIIGNTDLLRSSFGVGAGTLGFVKVAQGSDPVQVSNTLKRDFARLGMQTTVIAVLIGDFVQVGQSFLGVFEGFLALGLVVGIAGLGIISIRSVVERRKEIGILRALGFRKKMVLAAFLLENTYVSLTGILIGVALGIDLGYAISSSPGSQLNFILPWQSLIEIVLFAYGLAMLTTLSSARRAARIPPAEALRYTE